MHIIPRWRKFLNCEGGDVSNNVTPGSKAVNIYYNITSGLKAANINKKEFVKCWNFVKSRTTPEEIFSWFKDARFGQVTAQPARRPLRVAFVRKILQRRKDIEVNACICVFHV